jgi:hypothetical protein
VDDDRELDFRIGFVSVAAMFRLRRPSVPADDSADAALNGDK